MIFFLMFTGVCVCGKCKDTMTDTILVGAVEFCCCKEVKPALGKLIFYDSIERVKCITEHESFPF